MAEEYRTASAEDELPIDGIMEIELSSFAVPWTREDFLTLASRDYSVTVLAEANGAVSGYGCAVSVEDEAEILNLAVDAGRRRRGVGRELLSRMVKIVAERGAKRVFLEVRRSNEGARELYSSFGFSEIGVRRNYYRLPTEDAIVMLYETTSGKNGDGISK